MNIVLMPLHCLVTFCFRSALAVGQLYARASPQPVVQNGRAELAGDALQIAIGIIKAKVSHVDHAVIKYHPHQRPGIGAEQPGELIPGQLIPKTSLRRYHGMCHNI